ncbi:putative beta-amyrin synthase [Helianthus anomalus]
MHWHISKGLWTFSDQDHAKNEFSCVDERDESSGVLVKDNPSGDFESMHHHISKGSWTFSNQDHA